MFNKLTKRFTQHLYVQIWENRIKVTNIESKIVFDEEPLIAIRNTDKGKVVVAIGNNAATESDNNIEVINPFSHPRTLLSDFTCGEKVLQNVFLKITRNKWFKIAPRVVIQPMEKTEGGLTQIEDRAFKELAIGAGAREVILHYGAPILSFDFEELKAKNSEPRKKLSHSNLWWNTLMIIVFSSILIPPIWEVIQSLSP